MNAVTVPVIQMKEPAATRYRRKMVAFARLYPVAEMAALVQRLKKRRGEWK